ncbi:hypothetical protein [Sulfitobacter sp. UBA4523]|jgi:hypothetical protein|uniref:hypothetical protein n=1 Tax=Sulfitobacter sp. UBA4523 TaxID=1947584 RepID=UPI000C5C8C80|nr:hypothetical protein [Sulfitobacter sp. UBA4523]MAX76582.1 hypothetical protein [Roseobacter sp.]HBR41799.1 hypothetical protein [Sulfitobacter pontiacus]|tara:strand:+ start:31705 stop:32058 length:354 start_codon:yes stop_codon:yes gene_type:complete
MKNKAIASSLLLIAACGGVNEAITKYGSTKPVTYEIGEEKWRIFDQPENNRLMITPTVGASAGQGAVTGITYGLARNPYSQRETFEPPAAAYLSTRQCKITEGHLVVNTQFEFKYSC